MISRDEILADLSSAKTSNGNRRLSPARRSSSGIHFMVLQTMSAREDCVWVNSGASATNGKGRRRVSEILRTV
jgi:hypothetical protein